MPGLKVSLELYYIIYIRYLRKQLGFNYIFVNIYYKALSSGILYIKINLL
jgi:hypothetical protein